MNSGSLTLHLFIELSLILIAVRTFGLVARRCGQPQVVGEMMAGLFLGPSVFGFLAPAAHQLLFPQALQPILYCLSQLGLVLYMFLIGLEFNSALFVRHLRGTALIAAAGTFGPCIFGALLALTAMNSDAFFPASVSPLQRAAFTAAAMSVTALPVLARILRENALSSSTVGVIAIGVGVFSDVVAWILLAIVLALVSNDSSLATVALAGTALYAVAMVTVVRPLLVHFEAPLALRFRRDQMLLGAILPMLFLSALTAELIGVHAVFGAFMLGLCMPRRHLARELQGAIEPLTTRLFVPLYFVYSGLNTHITFLLTPELALYSVVTVAVACLAKVACGALAARLTGYELRESLMVGALMNARGLMELILLNIALERGLITQAYFSIMVVMALATTFLAMPLFQLFSKVSQGKKALSGDTADVVRHLRRTGT